jgi:hypothetical protein
MNVRTGILTTSLGLNFVLIALLVLQPGGGALGTSSSGARAPAGTGDAPGHPRSAIAGSLLETPTVSPWRDVPEAAATDVIARFRAAGYPENVVRAVAGELVAASFAERRRQLQSRPAEYWENPQRVAERQMAQRNELAIVAREEANMMRTLLGSGEGTKESESAARAGDFAYLSAEKADKLQRILADYSEMTVKAEGEAKGVQLPEDHAKRALFQREQRADIERLLSPAELLEFDLRTSPTAESVRRLVRKFDTTEAEFRALYAAQKAFDDRFPRTSAVTTPDMAQARQAAQAQLDAQFQQALGADRYAAMQAANESAWRGPDENALALQRLSERLGLPPATPTQVAGIRDAAFRQAAALQANSSLSPERRMAELSRLTDDAAAKLRATLTPTGFEYYRQHGGEWLKFLNSGPAATAKR